MNESNSTFEVKVAVLRAFIKATTVALVTALAVFVLLSLISATISPAHAVKMDLTTHDMIIKKLELGLDGLDDSNDKARPGIQLRLADLYADRARLKAMDEVERNCQNCNGAVEDRKLAIKTYQEALPNIPKEKQGSILLQIAHLQAANGDTASSQALYIKIVKAKPGTYSSRVKAMAYSAIGEKYFRAGNFKDALKNFNLARQHDLKAKGFVEYRISWCLLNLKQEKKATQNLIKLLNNPKLMATQTTEGDIIDTTFADDISGDLAIFLARSPVTRKEIQLLRRLSPDKVRKDNLKVLAEETDRLGKKGESLVVWATYVDEGNVSPMEKLEVQARVSQIFYDMNKQDYAANSYEKTMAIWKQYGCSEAYTCEELKTRLKKFVTAWNKAQKDEPTNHVFRSYMAYLSVFNDDAEMFQWAAVVAKTLKKYNLAADLFHSASIVSYNQIKKNEKDEKPDKTSTDKLKNIFEGSLLAEIEMAEATKNSKRQEDAYNWYLTMNPNGPKALEVRYQRAHLYYKAKQGTQAYAEFNWIARQPGKNEHILKLKAADLALDILADMKNDQELLERSQEYVGFFPERKSEYNKISRTASLNIAEKKSNDPDAALVVLLATNMQGASDQEKIKFYKNKIILAQQARKLDMVEDGAESLLKIKSLTSDDREYAFEQIVWVSELKLNFAKSYRLTQKMELPRLSKTDRLLRLALLAELSGNNPRPHYERYLQTNRNQRANNLVRVTLIKNANFSWKEIEKHQSHLKNSPELLAPLVLEAFANDRDFQKADRMIKTTRISRYAAGATLARQLTMRDLIKFDRTIRSHQLLGYNDRVLNKTLKERLKLLATSERNANLAVKKRDWSLQMLALTQLARENRRLYNEISDLPVPRGLKGEDRQRYLDLLASQSLPYLQKANQLDQETAAMWNQSETIRNIENVFAEASPQLQKLYKDELTRLSQTAPSSAKNRLDNLLNTPSKRPSRQEVMVARRELQANPWDTGKAEHLRELESQTGGYSMVAYLDARLNELKKRKNL